MPDRESNCICGLYHECLQCGAEASLDRPLLWMFCDRCAHEFTEMVGRKLDEALFWRSDGSP